ncbi:MAG TPA: helix-turn-helix transcriptional regulator [Verrucomicrobiae bacterium]|nr:helix-turn-helix transcriptional regulator [Verrucomicrobiae bacterium]
MERLTQKDVVRADAAEMTLLSQALELSGQGVILLTKNGRVLLISPRARAWLAGYFGASPSWSTNRLPDSLRRWRKRQEAQLGGADGVPPPRTPFISERGGKRLVVRHLCNAETCHLFLEEQPTARKAAAFAPLGLTRREIEVLQWVAQGKTNMEIGSILGLSHRTVQKHLEHVFKKLGVETRIAAATLVLG